MKTKPQLETVLVLLPLKQQRKAIQQITASNGDLNAMRPFIGDKPAKQDKDCTAF
ncbi:hypothetical protein PALB_8650 [Pseudoalteromonas luteoviolacea B = ATCC 29581]|nr:hypothetical protein PALB_8650 [Pseudoalteromonas luteoviolacea B = ATCC 29581]